MIFLFNHTFKQAKLIDANEHIKEQDAYSNRLQKDLVEAQKVYKQLRVIERERRLADEEVANLDEKLASIRNETKEDIQRLTIENDRLRNKETRELEDLEEEVKNKTLHVEDLEQSLSRSQGREMLMSRERDVALIEAERGAKELAATQARCVALSKAHEEAVMSCSKLKVENVVKAPRNPTAIPSRRATLISGRSRKTVASQPRASEPSTFTTNVP